ncbi:unnamed protein product [Orchesella dallaii]|uniref:Uncharacterized protein n=1 Tax=Orchesella dallaii TaxID=48710 RepID=A0ABP1QCY6_9HEXA
MLYLYKICLSKKQQRPGNASCGSRKGYFSRSTHWNCLTGFRTDVEEKNEALFCAHRKHLTFKPSATCCANQVIKPGLELSNWQSCRKEGQNKADNLIKTSWNMYACLLKKSGAKDTITLQEFADLIAADYPDEIKTKINEEIPKVSPPLQATLEDIPKLEKLRVTYFDIETAVCSGMASEPTSYGKIEACSTWKEENHRAGMCCKRSLPVDIRFKSLLDLNNDDGAKDFCRSQLLGSGVRKLNVTETMEQNLLEVCDVVCAMKKNNKIQNINLIMHQREYWNFDINTIFTQGMLPAIVPDNLVQEAIQYASSKYSFNDTIAAMKNFEFADTIPGDSNTDRTVHFHTYVKLGNKTNGDKFKLEFIGRKWHKGVIHIPILCSAYREILSLMEHYLFQDCTPEDVTEGPMEASAPEETPAPEPDSEPTPAPEPDSEPTPAPSDADAGSTDAPA